MSNWFQCFVEKVKQVEYKDCMFGQETLGSFQLSVMTEMTFKSNLCYIGLRDAFYRPPVFSLGHENATVNLFQIYDDSHLIPEVWQAFCKCIAGLKLENTSIKRVSLTKSPFNIPWLVLLCRVCCRVYAYKPVLFMWYGVNMMEIMNNVCLIIQ